MAEVILQKICKRYGKVSGRPGMPEAGSRLDVTIELDRMHVFDAEAELRMAA